MTEEQGWKAHEIKEQLWDAIHDLVDTKLEGVDEEIANAVRLQLNEQFRFWKRDAFAVLEGEILIGGLR